MGLILLAIGGSVAGSEPVVISEFMAANTRILADEGGQYPDWIEIHNGSLGAVDLRDWSLTDDVDEPHKWRFPSTNLAPGAFLVVFASGKDRRDPGAPLHTNFRLDPDGEYLALIPPGEETATSVFAPQYPRQWPDVSFGTSLRVTSSVLLTARTPVRWLVPIDASVDTRWMKPDFLDSHWPVGTNGVGYETGQVDPVEQSHAAHVMQTGPVAYWRLNETAGVAATNLGSLGAAAQGTYHEGVRLGTVGPRPPAFGGFESANVAPEFDGASGFVGGPTGLLDNLSQFSLAGWICPAGVQASRTGLFGENDTIEFGFIDNATLQLWTPAGQVDIAYPFPQGEWHHVAATGDAAGLAVYFDGRPAAASPGTSGNFGASGAAFNIGGGGVFDGSGNYFVGQIDEVAVWTRALTSQEVSGLLAAATPAQVDFTSAIATDLRGLLYGRRASCYLRIPFQVPDPGAVTQLTLRLRYDDGFVAYLNGQEVVRRNAPDVTGWNSVATGRHEDNLAMQFEDFDISAFRGFLEAGSNILAVHGLNLDPTNADFLVQAELRAAVASGFELSYRYFTQPTPGRANGFGTVDLGPIIRGASHAPVAPGDTDDVVVTAHVAPAFNSIACVTLNYRILFGPEASLRMNDGGVDGDTVAGDGIWTAVIPAGASAPGQMIRYFILASDTEDHSSRWPVFLDPANSEAYQGTMVVDPSIQSALPVIHLFIENNSAADTRTGTRGSIYYLGELYDNVLISVHGQSSSGWPKKSYNIDFTGDHRFKYATGGARQKDIKLLSPYGDKTRMHNTLAYEAIAAGGGAGHFSFPVRVQRNGAFYGIEDLMEDADDVWLERLGRDPNGSLYKMYNNAGSAGGSEKKTRLWENFNDLQTFINNLDESRPLDQRVLYAYDHLDLPQTISYFATLALISSQDHGHKNFYLYCDSDRTREWAIFPWDVDLSWGRNWVDRLGYFSDLLYQDNVLTFYNQEQQGKPDNRLYNLVFDHPDFRRMYLRRLRTLMDKLLRPPGTPAPALVLEARIRQLAELMDPPGVVSSDGDLDRAKWGPTWGNASYSDLRVEAERTITVHLAGRRDFLFSNPSASLRGERIPTAQPAAPTISLTAGDAQPSSGNQDEEYVLLSNPNAFAVDVSDWQLAGGIRHTFKPGTVIPAQGALYVSPNVVAFRARATGPRGGQRLFVQGDYQGHLSAWGEILTLTDDTGRLVSSNRFVGTPSLAQQFLRITEIMYHPAPSPGAVADPQSLEYIELRNTATTTVLDLAGVRLTEGIQFNFTGAAVTRLSPGQTVLVVRNLEDFTAHYGSDLPVAGEFTGALDNAGESLRLEDAVGEKILEFVYDNQWYPITDGLGFSLVIRDETIPWNLWGQKEHWRPSAGLKGSPGTVDPPPPPAPSVRVNEILAHSQPPAMDAIELHNPSAFAVSIGGWFLTDDFFAPRKYRIPDGLVLPPGGYVVFSSNQFGLGPDGFLLSRLGDEAFLFAADAGANLTGYYQGFEFGASPPGVSFGLHLTSEGMDHWVLQSQPSLGFPNGSPRVGPLVLSEIMYHPADTNGLDNDLDEFLELQNLAATNLPLFEATAPSFTWRLRNAVDYDFPPNTIVPAGQRLLVVGFNPTNAAQLAWFRQLYGVANHVPVYGPWRGKLDNSSETVELESPDLPEITLTNVEVPYVLIDQVTYRDTAPWPASADGLGSSLQRRTVGAYGNDPTNWLAAGTSAGRSNVPDELPTVLLTEPTNGTVFPPGSSIVLSASASDPDGTVVQVEFWDGTRPLVTLAQSPYTWIWTNAPAGQRRLRARAVDDLGAVAESVPVEITVISPWPVLTLTSPIEGTIVAAGTPVTLLASVSDPDRTLAGVDFYIDQSMFGTATTAPYRLDWPAVQGSHTVRAVARNQAGDLGAPVSARVFVQAVVTNLSVLVPAGSAWNYLDDGSDQGTHWIGLGFDDGNWSNGLAELGYGDRQDGRPETTEIRYGANAGNKHVAYYFRRCFVLGEREGFTQAELRVLRDDGAIAYLNGIEIFRDNLPDGAVDFQTLATNASDDGAEFHTKLVDSNLLRAGTNVLAVEVHQSSRSSSDISFDAQLVALGIVVGPAITHQPQNQTHLMGESAAFPVSAIGTQPLQYQWRFNGTPLTGETAHTLTLPNLQPVHGGDYTVVISNPAGSVTSAVAVLTVRITLEDQDGDGMPDAWESAHGTQPNVPDAEADADRDGHTNLQEYRAGTHPNDPASVLRFLGVESSDDTHLRFTFMSVTNHTYTIEFIDGIPPSSQWQFLTRVPAPRYNQIETVTTLRGPETRFYRIVTPPQP